MSRYSLLLTAWLAALTCLGGCESHPHPADQLDVAWHRQDLMEGLLSHWLAAAPTPSGFMQTNLERDWTVKSDGTVELTYQARVVYALFAGFQVSGDARYLEAARRGADFMLRHFQDPTAGGLFRAVDEKGKVVNGQKHAYGHAFAILAWAEAYRATRDEAYRVAALQAWRALSAGLRDPEGGFRPQAPRNFGLTHENRTQNPVMHLFEAMLALADATDDPEARAGAESIGRFVLYNLLQTTSEEQAYIPEMYDETWKVLPQQQGGYIDLGHQFEWAYLMSNAGARGWSEMYTEAGRRLMDYALAVGYDHADGGSFDRMDPDGTLHTTKRWWEQSECLRSLMHFAAKPDYRDLWDEYRQTLDLIRQQFVDSVNGGWRMRPVDACGNGDCPTIQAEPYHMVGMHREALELAARPPHTE